MADLTDPQTIAAINDWDAIAATWVGAFDSDLRAGLAPLTGGTVGTTQALPSSPANNQTLIILAILAVIVVVSVK